MAPAGAAGSPAPAEKGAAGEDAGGGRVDNPPAPNDDRERGSGGSSDVFKKFRELVWFKKFPVNGLLFFFTAVWYGFTVSKSSGQDWQLVRTGSNEFLPILS